MNDKYIYIFSCLSAIKAIEFSAVKAIEAIQNYEMIIQEGIENK